MSDRNFLQWKVKPIWKIYFPSSKIGTPSDYFKIYGVDRGSLDISRNWAKIHSVERFNQGFIEQPTDFTITIAVKENGNAFEKLRRLAMGQMFDIEVDVVRVDSTVIGDLEEEYAGSIDNIDDYVPWMRGFEKFVGCVVNREGQTVDIGAFPVREFEIIFLEREIQKTDRFNTAILKEGDGSYPDLDDLGLT